MKLDHKSPDLASRKYQAWAVDTILKNWETKQFVVLQAPTGVGKSIIGMVAQYEQSPYGANKMLTSTKSLQRQYISSFDIFGFYGAQNYKCNTGEAKFWKDKGCSKKRCVSFAHCDYQVAKATAELKPAVINYASAFSLPTLFADAEVVVFDEAHDAESTILDCHTQVLDLSVVSRGGVIGPVWDDLASVRRCIDSLEIAAERMTDENDEDFRMDVKKLKIASRREDFLFVPDVKGKRCSFRPKFVTRRMIDNVCEGKKVLFMSASLGSFTQFCKDMAISRDEAAYVKIPEVFDPSHTPVSLEFSVGRLNMGNIEEKIPQICANLDAILKRHEGQRGLVHVSSYALGEMILNSLHMTQEGLDRCILVTSNDYEQYLDREDVVLVSPSLHTGVSFDDDLARFNVLLKAPFPYLGDPWINFRKDHDRLWYSNVTSKVVHQQFGRTTRSPDDWSTVYVIDDAIRKFLPDNAVFVETASREVPV